MRNSFSPSPRRDSVEPISTTRTHPSSCNLSPACSLYARRSAPVGPPRRARCWSRVPQAVRVRSSISNCRVPLVSLSALLSATEMTRARSLGAPPVTSPRYVAAQVGGYVNTGQVGSCSPGGRPRAVAGSGEPAALPPIVARTRGESNEGRHDVSDVCYPAPPRYLHRAYTWAT